jgi:hypothetical protein
MGRKERGFKEADSLHFTFYFIFVSLPITIDHPIVFLRSGVAGGAQLTNHPDGTPRSAAKGNCKGRKQKEGRRDQVGQGNSATCTPVTPVAVPIILHSM